MTCTTCNSELVLSARSAAVRAANPASLEASVARRILVGKMLICMPHPLNLSSIREDCPTDHLRLDASRTVRSGYRLGQGRTLSRPRTARRVSRYVEEYYIDPSLISTYVNTDQY